MDIKISTYWKCQLIGWGSFTIITYLALIIGYPHGQGFFSRAVITCVIGLGFTHVIRLIIRNLAVFKKKFPVQIVYMLIITVVVTFIANLVYVFVLNKTGILAQNQIPGFNEDTLVRTFSYLYYQELMVAFGWVSIYFLVHYIRGIRMVEREKAAMKIQLIESEAAALRAQMNPHFIFNSLNSIKSLINNNENEHAANYLTTFSKLIRTLFQNSDKREISLFEELETCRLYTQIEKMRFGNKVDFKFDIDTGIDLKDVKVPALILQPFIENAIWHGLVPKESGGRVFVSLAAKNGSIECIIDDNGIGRALSKQSKAQYETGHEPKGIGLTQSRLELDKLLNDREDAIQITDKVDAEGHPAGTRVVLTFNREKTS